MVYYMQESMDSRWTTGKLRLNFFQAAHDDKGYGKHANNIGAIYLNRAPGRLKSLQLAEKPGDTSADIFGLTNVGGIYPQ